METYICEICGSKMVYYDRVKRYIKEENGTQRMIFVKRFRCNKCKKTFRKNSREVFFRKHYRKDIILGFINGDLNNDILEFENYPCELTVKRWCAEITIPIMDR